MPVEFQIPSLRVQVQEHLGETESEQHWLETLLELEEGQIHRMWIIELDPCRRKAFVNYQ